MTCATVKLLVGRCHIQGRSVSYLLVGAKKSSCLQLIPKNTRGCFGSKVWLPFFLPSEVFFTLWCWGAKAASLKFHILMWIKRLVCVRARAFSGRAAAAVRAGYRTGTYGLLGLSWLSERLKGRPLSGGSTREHRPLSLLFVASWRPAFKAQALPLPFKCKVKIMKSGRDKKKKCIRISKPAVEQRLFASCREYSGAFVL